MYLTSLMERKNIHERELTSYGILNKRVIALQIIKYYHKKASFVYRVNKRTVIFKKSFSTQKQIKIFNSKIRKGKVVFEEI